MLNLESFGIVKYLFLYSLLQSFKKFSNEKVSSEYMRVGLHNFQVVFKSKDFLINNTFLVFIFLDILK